MAGHDLEIDGPRFVALELGAATSASQPDYFRGDVDAALLEVFSSRVLPDGGAGSSTPTTSPSASRST